MDYGVIVDVETTGLDAKKDAIIEIGVLEFGLEEKKLPAILSMYSGLEDPGEPLSKEIVQLTGLTDDVLHNQRIDWDLVESMLARASVCVAHNAKFDAAFLANREELKDSALHWACSVRHLPWRTLGFKSQSLNYLAADHGFINPFSHRALFDCATTFRLISPHIDDLISRSYDRELRIAAVGSPFETKDKLKARGYRWDQKERVWHKTVLERDLAPERDFLSAEVYGGEPQHIEQVVN